MFKGIDHVVISVKDMPDGRAKYNAIFGRDVDRTGEATGFLTAHFDFESTTVELVQPTDETGPVAKHVDRTGGGVYLLAMAVADMSATIDELRAKGVRLIGDPGEGNPVTGQVFIHPRDTGGVLMQIVPER